MCVCVYASFCICAVCQLVSRIFLRGKSNVNTKLIKPNREIVSEKIYILVTNIYVTCGGSYNVYSDFFSFVFCYSGCPKTTRNSQEFVVGEYTTALFNNIVLSRNLYWICCRVYDDFIIVNAHRVMLL